jgi:tRNA dimethylallyltransferase
MIERGLIEEAKPLYNYRDLNALNTVGYKELFKSVEGTWSIDKAIEEIKKNSRRYAKRQLTWFKKDSNTKWYDYQTPQKTVINYIESKLASFSTKD